MKKKKTLQQSSMRCHIEGFLETETVDFAIRLCKWWTGIRVSLVSINGMNGTYHAMQTTFYCLEMHVRFKKGRRIGQVPLWQAIVFALCVLSKWM